MRIGFITDDYHPRVDGVVVYIDTMSQALRELGHEVYIVCPKYKGYSDSDGYVIRTPSVDPLPLSKLKSNMMVTTRKSVKSIAQIDLDIIHVHTQAGANFTGYELSKLTAKKLITTMHTTYHPLVDVYPFTSAISGWLANSLAAITYKNTAPILSLLKHPIPTKKNLSSWILSYGRAVLDSSDMVLVNSEHTEEYVKSFGSDTPVTIVRNGIDTSLFRPQRTKSIHNPPRLVYTGRLSGEKHQEIVIQSVYNLKSRGIDVELNIVGDGPYRKSYERQVDELNLRDRVSFSGEVGQKEIAEILDRCDVGLLASYHFDTNPLSVMEYLAAGLPVVYCDENFDGMFGEDPAIRCDFSPEGFADAIKALISEPGSYRKMSEAAIHASEKHDISIRGRELEKIYMSMLSK